MNIILSENLNLRESNFSMHRGNLTLPEAWFIKVLIWDLMAELEKNGRAPNWIYETCNPTGIKPTKTGQTTIYINTADPSKAASRVKARGDQSGRYVSATVAAGSYRWPWINFIEALDKISNDAGIKIIDTDIMYADKSLPETKRMELANIATVEHGILKINNLNHFLSFISRSFRINPLPKNTKEIWKQNAKTFLPLIREIDKLYHLKSPLQIEYAGRSLSREDFFALIGKLYFAGLRPLENVRQRLNLFALKESNNHSQNTQVVTPLSNTQKL